MKASWIMTAGLILLALAVPLVLTFVFDEVEEVPQGGLDYWLGVPETVKRVPIISPCDAPRYSALNARGDSPPLSLVRFGSERSPEHLRDVLRGHFTAEGCMPGETALSTDGLLCPDGSEVAITVVVPEETDDTEDNEDTEAQGPRCTPVTVSIFNVDQG